ncbi:MAG: hypothetical protein WKF84_02320 [Pyrinomonadaceae bacterium]
MLASRLMGALTATKRILGRPGYHSRAGHDRERRNPQAIGNGKIKLKMNGEICFRRMIIILLMLGAISQASTAQEGAPISPPQTPAPKKLNARPANVAATNAIEPFDGVAVAKLAESCVTPGHRGRRY